MVFRMEAEFLIPRWTGSLAERVGGEGRAKPRPVHMSGMSGMPLAAPHDGVAQDSTRSL